MKVGKFFAVMSMLSYATLALGEGDILPDPSPEEVRSEEAANEGSERSVEMLGEVQQKDDGRREMNFVHYVAGGAVGTFLGLGIGHAIQGRWANDWGWVHSLAQPIGMILAVGGMGAAEACQNEAEEEYGEDAECEARKRDRYWMISLSGALMVISSRITETITVWLPSQERYRIVMHAQVTPVIEPFDRSIGLALNVSLP